MITNENAAPTGIGSGAVVRSALRPKHYRSKTETATSLPHLRRARILAIHPLSTALADVIAGHAFSVTRRRA
jgi:hypothetical protein